MKWPIKSILGTNLNHQLLNDLVFDQISDKGNDFLFASQATKSALKKYQEAHERSLAKNVWKELLIDAICLLKINDGRELASQNVPCENFKDFQPKFEAIRKSSSFGITGLESYFDDFVAFESVLYSDRFYRDHILHVLDVWALGASLIFSEVGINVFFGEGYKSNRDTHFHKTPSRAWMPFLNCTNSNDQEISAAELWAMWTIIALCHDLGYPVEKSSKINSKVKNIISHFGCITFNSLAFKFDLLNTFLIDKFLKIISSKVTSKKQSMLSPPCFRTEIQQKYFDKFSKSLEDYRHGMFSGLLLFKKLVYFLETDYTPELCPISPEDARQFFIRREILRAICGHTCSKIYHIRLNTLAFILIVCDEIQEWNRPRFEQLLEEGRKDYTPPVVKIEKFETGGDTTEIKVKVIHKHNLGTNEKTAEALVLKKFQDFIYLLRSAKDDGTRKDKFSWEISFADDYNFKFDFGNNGNCLEFTTVCEFKGDTTSFDVYDKASEILAKIRTSI